MVSCFGGPTPLRPAAIVVGPDDLVDEARPAEDAVEQHLAVVRLAVVDVEEERARGGEHPVGLDQSRLEEGQVVVEAIPIAGLAERGGPIALALEAGPVSRRVLLRAEGHPRLGAPGVEGRVDIDEVDAAGTERTQYRQIVLEDDPQHRPADFGMLHDRRKVAQGCGFRNALPAEEGVGWRDLR